MIKNKFSKKIFSPKKMSAVLVSMLSLLFVCSAIQVGALTGPSATYTLDADFDEGALINVNHDSPNNNQLQLNDTTEPFNFIWVAASTRGTIVKIDTVTGAVLGEYLSAPNGRGRNPSRTTVDANGNVWAGNRGETTGNQGSVVHIGLEENGQCVDRNSNGVIDTSIGLGDIKPWSNSGGADNNGGVSTADDECIIHYVRTLGRTTRHVSIDANNNVWVGSHPDNSFALIDSVNGNTLASFNVGCGGYGGLVDSNGVLWSASRTPANLLRYDTNDDTWACLYSPNSYGLGIDSNGNIWHSQFNNSILKFDPAGVLFAGFPKSSGGASGDRGVAVTPDDNVWVANSRGSDVSRLNNNGNLVKVITVGSAPTGVSVDAAGKVWVTNLGSNNAMRIDPNGGIDGNGLVDLTVQLGSGASPYNYSDMTGSIVPAPPTAGSWTIVHDSEIDNLKWGIVRWTADEPGDSSIVVKAASSNDGVNFGSFEIVSNGIDLTVGNGRYLKVMVLFARSSTDEDNNGVNDSPILYDLTIGIKEIPVDIKPTSCRNPLNTKSNGVLPVAILGTADFDVNQINPATVQLEGVSPLRHALEDVAAPFYPFVGKEDAFDCTTEGPDGFTDLMMHFDKQEIVTKIGDVDDGDVLVLQITGNLVSGQPIIGEDVIVILKKGK